MKVPSKLPLTGTSIFAVMSELAAEHDAVNLSQGFPDFAVSTELIESVSSYMKSGHNQYAPMPGIPELRRAIASKIVHCYGREYDADSEITVTPGATVAIYAAITAVVNVGDEVIVFDPAYDSYRPSVELSGGKTIGIPLVAPDFSVNWKLVREKITPKTRMIIINTPHNPTGSVMSASDLSELELITRDTDIVVLSDEVYEHIIFDEQEHQSVIRYPGLAERSFAVFSFGKTFHATGWKVGYCVAPKELMSEFRKIYQFVNFTSNRPVQHGIADYLTDPGNYENLGAFYQERRDYFLNLIKDSRFSWKPAQGTYFQSISFQDISDESDVEYAARLTREQKVATIPTSVFNGDRSDPKMLRICFAKSNETLERGAEVLCKI